MVFNVVDVEFTNVHLWIIEVGILIGIEDHMVSIRFQKNLIRN